MRICRGNRGAGFIISFCLILISVPMSSCKNSGVWNGKQAAVVLTYDDALESHFSIVYPLLNANDFRATFYVPAGFSSFRCHLHEKQSDHFLSDMVSCL